MAKKRVKFSKQGFEQLRKSPAIREDLMRRAKKVAEAAGGQEMGYKVTDLVLEKPRAATSIMATGKAARHNRRTNALIKALDAAR